MTFGSPKSKPSWYKIMKFGVELAEKRIDYIMEESAGSFDNNSRSISTLTNIKTDTKSLVTDNNKIENSKYELN